MHPESTSASKLEIALTRLARWTRGLAILLACSAAFGAISFVSMTQMHQGIQLPGLWFGALWFIALAFEVAIVAILLRASRRIRRRDPKLDPYGIGAARALAPYLGLNALVASLLIATWVGSLVLGGLR